MHFRTDYRKSFWELNIIKFLVLYSIGLSNYLLNFQNFIKTFIGSIYLFIVFIKSVKLFNFSGNICKFFIGVNK